LLLFVKLEGRCGLRMRTCTAAAGKGLDVRHFTVQLERAVARQRAQVT
jgi:hypothetical protein